MFLCFTCKSTYSHVKYIEYNILHSHIFKIFKRLATNFTRKKAFCYLTYSFFLLSSDSEMAYSSQLFHNVYTLFSVGME